MAQPFPYTYYACNCFDRGTGDDEERTFDPRSPRANYALFPLEHLLYCEDCLQIRCSRCVIEETLNWYCPSCLFEVPSSVVKSDGNRCTRNCFNCPVCTAPLSVNSVENPEAPSANGGPYILACSYCHWSTAETGIQFEKHTGINSQLSRLANGGNPILTQKDRDKERERQLKELEDRRAARHSVRSPTEGSAAVDRPTDELLSREDLFANLSAFYKTQIEAHTPSNPFAAHDLSFSSPSTYSRIMNLYTTTSKSKKRDKPPPMREAAAELEGLSIHDPASDTAAIERLKKDGWSNTLSPAQRLAQINPYVRTEDELRPVATLLCTKRSKRCRSCRHILSKPESKITSIRYKIKLLALNHIPRISIRALPSPTAQQPLPSASGPATSQPPPFNYHNLRQGIPSNFIVHLSNPLFDPVRVTLATPSITPGKVHSKVTILCPQFEIGANTDVWDDALSSSSAPVNKGTVVDSDGAIEPGKPYDRGRNWTSVVIEVIPGFLESSSSGFNFGRSQSIVSSMDQGPDGELEEDDDVIEIPIFVRLEFEADVTAEERGLGESKGGKDSKEKREEAFWTVVGVGKIAAV
ncbi:dynactin p62 family-domain-containing protein [Boeremia exigua]|uniref:dynactin p62 family-domain-containing protein n=1 Tax=Boeremia exigua TaxID=749465 RepID=UPI001E8D57A1|nr:dynactin p62 family-domain-containing protein [Boeremia exigua]KAH6633668.1 dynactin p62 family-domain-containing protein [Boeremia exigua]